MFTSIELTKKSPKSGEQLNKFGAISHFTTSNTCVGDLKTRVIWLFSFTILNFFSRVRFFLSGERSKVVHVHIGVKKMKVLTYIKIETCGHIKLKETLKRLSSYTRTRHHLRIWTPNHDS